MSLTFGEDRICRNCRGSGMVGGSECLICAGRGVRSEKVQVPAEPEKIERDLALGKVLRDQGMEKVARGEGTWNSVAISWIRGLPQGREFTADDLTGAIGLPSHRNAVGAALGGASKRGLTKRSGVDRSSRPDRHAGMVVVWVRR